MHISAFGAALRTPDLRKKILFTLGLLGLYRLGAVLPTPGVCLLYTSPSPRD